MTNNNICILPLSNNNFIYSFDNGETIKMDENKFTKIKSFYF